MKKFLIIFLVFIGLTNISNAFTLEPNIDYTNGNGNNSQLTSFANISKSTINTICMNYYNDSSNEEYISAFNDMISAFSVEGYDKYFIHSYKEPAGSNDVFAYFFPSTVDVCTNSTNSAVYFCIDSTESYIEWKGTVSRLYKVTATSPTICGMGLYGNSFYTNVNVKQTTPSAQSYYFYWDGTSYYYKAESDEPDFEGISDTQKAEIINSVVNSDEFKNIVPEHYRNQFFIIKNEWTNRYKVYFYPKQYYLKGRIFEADETEAITQKSYKIIATDSENFLWGVWQSINPFDYYVFSGYFNEDNTFNSYFYEYKDSHEMNQEYFSYQDEPIVYSSKDIGFVIYDITTNETTEDTENSISSTILKDDEGNEIEIVIPTDEGTENITFWDSIVQKIVNGIKTIFFPDFSSSLEFFEKLKTKFNFLFEVKDLISNMFNKLVYQTEPPSITVDLTTSNSKYNWGSSAIALDMSWYEPYKPTIDIFICAFCYGIFFWNLFRKLANIVSGVSGEGAQSSKGESK